MRPASFFLRALLAGVGGLLPLAAWPAKADERAAPAAAASDRAIEFNLPAQATADALLAFSKQAKIEVLFSTHALRKAQSPAVIGRFEPEDALRRLLQGTGFRAQRNGGQKFIITLETRPTGAIKGRLLNPDGNPARGARVYLVGTRLSAVTDGNGDFEVPGVTPGQHGLVIRADGCEPLQLAKLTVAADEVLTLATKTLQPVGDPSQLAPYFVKDRTTRDAPFDRSEATRGPRTAGSNLDLARTENDALPFNIYNRDQIARSGVVNLNEFLQREVLDGDAANAPPEQNLNAPLFAAGSTNLNLRAFGADQTIILVNGRRLPEALVHGGDWQTPDVNFIPLSLVQQVEVLPVSAASLYSGNAVGGIINIVLRPGVDAEATEATLTYTNALGGFDAPQSSASVMHARSLLGGALRVRVNASVTRTIPPTEAELGHRRRADATLPLESSLYRATPNIRSIALAPEEEVANAPPPVPPPLFGPGTPTVTSVAPGADGTGGLAAFRGREGVRNYAFFDPPAGFASSLESVDYPYGREQVRTAYFASAVCDLTPWLQVGLDGTYTRSVQHRGLDVFGIDLRLRAESPYNPFGQEAIVSLNETTPELGEHYSEARLEFGAVVLSALLKLPGGWRLLVDGQYGQNVAKYRGVAAVDGNRLQHLLDDGRYNPLRDTQVFGPPPEFYDEALIYRGGRGRFVTLGDYFTTDGSVRMTHHALALPTGRAAVNAGADYRRSYLARFNDERRYADGTLAFDPIRYAPRSLERYSIFGEVQAPLVPERWLPHWIRQTNGDLAVRYIASGNADESTVAPTFGLKVDLPAGLSFRGSVSTSSRYPTPHMSRLAVSGGAKTSGIVSVDVKKAYDPVQRQTYTIQHDEVLDPYLQPEGTVTQTAGFLLRRGSEHRLRAAIDFVDTRKANEVVNLDVQTILNLEQLFPERVIRLKESGPNGRAGDVLSVITGRINAEWRRSQNWNCSVDYAWTKCLGGTLEAYGRLLYYLRYEHLLLRGANIVDELEHPEGGFSSLLRYRSNFGTSWSNHTYGFGFDGHYFHSRVLPEKEWPAQGTDRIRPFWQFDAFVQSDLGRLLRWKPNRVRAQVRVNNMFSAGYPRYANAGDGAGVQGYGDWRGRVYSLSVTTTF